MEKGGFVGRLVEVKKGWLKRVAGIVRVFRFLGYKLRISGT